MKWCYIGLLGGIILTVLIILEYSFRKPKILFDIPENWEVTRMEIGEGCRERSYSEYYSGIVELTNKNGIKITFTQWTNKPLSCGNGSAFDYIVDYEIEKVCDANIINCKDDFKENCVIAKIFQKGCTSPEGEYSEYNTFCYAIVPESKTGVGSCNIVEFQEVCSFNYFAPYSAVTCLFDRSLTEEEEKEIIQILSNFNISDERGEYMRCNQVSISIERFGKFVPKNYPADVQRIHVYCDDYNSIYAALSKAYAMAINELGEYEHIGVRADVSTNEFSRADYRKMHGTVVSGKRSYEEDINFEYRDTRMELLKDLIWVYEHSEEIINLIQQSEDMDHVSAKLKEQYGLNDYQIRKLSQIRMDMLTKEDYQRAKEELEKMNATLNNQCRNQVYIRSERRRLQFEIRKLETYFKAAEHCEEIMKLFLETEDAGDFENSMKEKFGFERDESRLIRYFSIDDFSLRKRQEKRNELELLKERLEYINC